MPFKIPRQSWPILLAGILVPHVVLLSQGDDRMHSAHVDWSRYNSPAMCLAASRNIQHLTDRWPKNPSRDERRHGTLGDTIAYEITRDTLSSVTRATSQLCLAQISLDNIDTHDFAAALQMALRAGDDTLTMALVDRQLTHIRTRGAVARASLLRQSIEIVLDAHPPRVDLAKRLVDQLDALGDSVRLIRILVHQTLLQFYVSQLADLDAGRRELSMIETLAAALTPEDRAHGLIANSDIVGAARLRMLELEDPRALMPLFAEAIRKINQTDTASLAGGMRYAEVYYRTFMEPIDTPVPDITTTFVFSPKTKTPVADSTIRPRQGVMTVWVIAPDTWRQDLQSLRRFSATVKQLHARYGEDIDITIFTKTAGYVPGSGPLTAREEADAIKQLFLQEYQLPATLAIAESPMSVLPDGRRIYGNVPYEKLFFGTAMPIQMIVAGRDGRYLRVFDELRPSVALNQVLDQLVHP